MEGPRTVSSLEMWSYCWEWGDGAPTFGAGGGGIKEGVIEGALNVLRIQNSGLSRRCNHGTQPDRDT